MLVLGIESSCDDTAAALVEDGYRIVSSKISSQDEFHRRFGGVVPEIASRRHLEVIDKVTRLCLEGANVNLTDIDAIAVTRGPGLMGSLLVGLNFAKALAFATGLPFFGVDHLEGHLAAPFLGGSAPEYPLVSMVVSGGHTNIYLMRGYFDKELIGRTVDDAAGEAYDKVAKYIGLGYPGGRAIDELAAKGNAQRFHFPRPMIHSGDYNFSFSGLKTAVIQQVDELFANGDPWEDASLLADLAASFQEAVVDVLSRKLIAAAEALGVTRIALSGGVAANSGLRKRLTDEAADRQWEIHLPTPVHCTDNAAMVAAAGYHHLAAGEVSELDVDTYAGARDVPKGRLRKEEIGRELPAIDPDKPGK